MEGARQHHAVGSGDGDFLKWEVMWRRKLREKSRR